MIDWIGSRIGGLRQRAVSPVDTLRAPFLVVSGARGNALVGDFDQFRALYPKASEDERLAAQHHFEQGGRVLRVIPGNR